VSCGRVAESEVGEADSFGCGSVAVGFDGGHALDPYYAVGGIFLAAVRRGPPATLLIAQKISFKPPSISEFRINRANP
jgi:hypothetical protein